MSVVICCHNSAARLPETLSHLGAQKVTPDLPWEVIVVDNASTDDTIAVAEACWRRHPAAPLRVISEPRLGVAFARDRGVAEAQYEFVTFVDDDNWVANRWVEQAASLLQDHPDVGAVGGSSTPVFEGPSPDWFPASQTMYAISSDHWPAGECHRDLWTAGMTFRRDFWQELQAYPRLAMGHTGKGLAGGEDNEFCWRLRLAGWKLWYEPSLSFQHYMPKSRLSWAYARRLYRGSGIGAAALAPYRSVLDPPPSGTFRRLRNTWGWQVLQNLKCLFRYPRKLVQACTGSGEGDPDILNIEQFYGSLITLIRNRSSYNQGLRQVRELVEQFEIRNRPAHREPAQVGFNQGAKTVQ